LSKTAKGNGSTDKSAKARETQGCRQLQAGLIVHFHDIHLPYDYPPEWAHRYYNEQYLLAAYVLAGDRFQLLLPNAFITRDAELHKILDPIWKAPAMAGLSTYGASR
jgi:hypothetical protein